MRHEREEPTQSERLAAALANLEKCQRTLSSTVQRYRLHNDQLERSHNSADGEAKVQAVLARERPTRVLERAQPASRSVVQGVQGLVRAARHHSPVADAPRARR